MNSKLFLTIFSVIVSQAALASSLKLSDLKNTTIILSDSATKISISKGGTKMQVSAPIGIQTEKDFKIYKIVTIQNLVLLNEVGYKADGKTYSTQNLKIQNLCSLEDGCQIFDGTKKLEGQEAEAILKIYMSNDNQPLETQIELPSKEKFMSAKKSHEEIPTIVSIVGNPFSGEMTGMIIK